jgi:hypothetical protein
MTTNCSRWWSLFGSPEVIKGGHVRALSRIHSGGVLRSSFGIRRSGRGDTRGPVRNGASLRQPLVGCNCNRSANKSNHPIQNPLLLVTQTLHT